MKNSGKQMTVTTTTSTTINMNTMDAKFAEEPEALKLDRTPREDGEKRVYNLIILDESGSMSSIYEPAFSGANETIDTIKIAQKEHPEIKQFLTFVTFDTGFNKFDVRAIINNKPVDEVEHITRKDYSPCGSTPLYDAMGYSILGLRHLVEKGDNVLVTVITDGYENSSKHFNELMVKNLVESLREEGWVFTFIGANQSSVDVAIDLGISNAMDFRQDEVGTKMMFAKMNSSRRAYYNRVSERPTTAAMEREMQEDFFCEEGIAKRITPAHIDHLKPGQIFVFGSNLAGNHAGGAARLAVEKFGAVMGQGVGLQGQSYAIPTMHGGPREIAPYVDEFIRFADCHPELTFLVTRIGCGIAGFRPEQIAPLFAGASALPNVWLPADFWQIINYKW